MTATRPRRLLQEVGDTYQRALTGGLFYLMAWLIVGIYGGSFARSPLISWLLVVAFTGLALTRFAHRPLREGDGTTYLRWLYVHWGIVILTTMAWGLVFCWALLDDGFQNARTAALLSTLGLGTAVAHAFSMRRGFALTCIAMLYGPGLLLLWSDPVHRPTALVMLVYLVYVLISLVRSHAEYQQRLDLDQELRDQRDLFAQQSKIDPLTELANRRHFSIVLEEAATHAVRNGEPLTLLVLDLDHFKKINDTHGHAIGDACLIAIAGRLGNAFHGKGELVARLGGEEFAVVLAGQDLEQSTHRAECFREDLARHPVALDDTVVAMTASIGLAAFDRTRHRDIDELYSAADHAVYRAKAGGRNRVCRDEETAPAQATADPRNTCPTR